MASPKKLLNYGVYKVNNWLNQQESDLLNSRLANLNSSDVAAYYNISDYYELEIERMWIQYDEIHICSLCNSIPSEDHLVYIHGNFNTRSIHTMECYTRFYNDRVILPFIIRMNARTTAVVHQSYMNYHLSGGDGHTIMRNIPRLSEMDNFEEILDVDLLPEQDQPPPCARVDHIT